MKNDILVSFTAGSEERIEGYNRAKLYMEKYNSNSCTDQMHKEMLAFFTKEVELISGVKMDVAPVATYTNLSNVKEAAFAVISMLTQPIVMDATIKNFAPIAEIRNGDFGDSFSFDLSPRDLFVVTKGARSQKTYEIQTQFEGTKTIIPEFRNITVGVPLFDIYMGKKTLAEYMSKAIKSLNATLSYDIYDAFQAAMASLPTTGDAKLRVVGYTQDALLELGTVIEAWDQTPIVMGTKLALSKILPASTNYQFDLDSDYVKYGHLRDFFGFDIVELPQVADYRSEFKTKIANDELYLICPSSDKLVKVCMEGTILSNVGGNADTENLISVGNMCMSYGVGVITNALAGMIELT